MNNYRLADTEAKFADLIWKNEPVTSPELVRLCEKELNWKKSTTYTVLKKLCQRDIFQNKDTVITSLLTREQFYGMQSRKYVENTFGSLPRFLAAFSQGSKLTDKEVEELRRYIDDYRQ